ncbi:hypothetical protein H0H87_005088, partial [Tephrocybe sp. NHM501043]
MANSDNVIRAGLTPKLRDIPNLIATLTYTSLPASEQLVSPSPFPSPAAASSPQTPRTSTLYDPPIPEFSVVQTKLPREGEETHRAIDGPSIAIVTDGAGAVSWGGGQGEGGNLE